MLLIGHHLKKSVYKIDFECQFCPFCDNAFEDSESQVKKCLELIFEKKIYNKLTLFNNWGHAKVVNAQKSRQTQTHLHTLQVYRFQHQG